MPRTPSAYIRLLQLVLVALALSVATRVASYFMYERLPAESQLFSEISAAPMQQPTEGEEFAATFGPQRYIFEPLADYEFTGLIVSHNDPFGWADIYHDLDSPDVKDICVIWGPNLTERVYRNTQFYSESWTCNYRPLNAEANAAFDGRALSNNHLIPADKMLARRIVALETGDQVRVRGKLVNYYPAGQPDLSRRSSLVRDDTGNGACEVVWVESLSLLKKGNSAWSRIYHLSGGVMKLLSVLTLIALFTLPYLDYKYG